MFPYFFFLFPWQASSKVAPAAPRHAVLYSISKAGKTQEKFKHLKHAFPCSTALKVTTAL